jgi:hypothetical protein
MTWQRRRQRHGVRDLFNHHVVGGFFFGEYE